MIDYEKVLSSKVKEIKPSGIRRFFDIANEMEHVISLSIGEPTSKLPGTSGRRGYAPLKRVRPGTVPTGDSPH